MNDETFIAINPKAIPKKALVSDLVYTPLETNLLKMAKDSFIAKKTSDKKLSGNRMI